MKSLLLVGVCLLPMSVAHATCATDAADKKLAGAAKTSFMARCERDARQTCELNAVSSTGKPLSGAAKNSSITRCVADKVGS
jgi:hypothetical protein